MTDKYKHIFEARKATAAKRKLQVCHVYKVKIVQSKLSKKQKEQLKMLFVEAKWIYNNALSFSESNSIYDYNLSDTVSHFDKDKNEVETKLNYISSQMKQSVLDGIKSSIKMLSTTKSKGQKVGKLRYLSEYKSINLKQYNKTYKFVGRNRIKIQRVSGSLLVRGLDQFKSIPNIEYANAKLLNTASGYYIAITTYVSKKQKETENDNLIGLDFGCTNTLTTSNGDKFNVIVEETERLKRLQRKLQVKKKRSNSYNRIKLKLKREYEHISNIKTDKANKLAALIHSQGRIIIQDEQINKWHQTDLLSGKVQHSILGRLKTKLMSYSDTIILSKWLPTTKLCHKCGSKIELKLSDRQFVCSCGVNQDRDIHAANNMIFLYKILVGAGRTDFKRDEKGMLKEIEAYFEEHEDTTL